MTKSGSERKSYELISGLTKASGLFMLLLLAAPIATRPCAAQALRKPPSVAVTAPVVQTQHGRLQGVSEGGMRIFRGIAYAEAPVGGWRFRSPQPVQPWQGVRLASAFGPKAAQVAGGAVQGEENCLTLNVWAPATAAANSRKPVVVWVHGGAFTGGSGSDFNGAVFAQRDDIVTVSINYRLGSLGFLYLGEALGREYRESSNCGLLDAIAALRWVHQNISAFGGDPARVTVMGESAGAKLVSAVLVAPAAQGLFQQVILESGAVQSIRDTLTAATVTRRLLEELHLPADQARQLLTLPTATLLQAQAKIASGPGGLQLFGPVLDGKTLPTPPLDYLSQPNRTPVRVLMGTNREEAGLFINMWPTLTSPNREVLTALFGKNDSHVWQAYTAAQARQAPEQAWLSVLTDYLYRLATYRMAQTLADTKHPVWLYRFDYQDNEGQRPVHARELGYVWNSLPGTPASASSAKTEGQQLAEQMHTQWVQFIRTGSPSAVWPRYTASRQIMVFDSVSRALPLTSPYEDPAFPVQGFVL
ncbi:carboxylesterase/lipase family protein [Hymenobacter jejuensis]|uniref:Carboxylic ester hydrolase n=1 Tax=Hymenobacter jejuensis TaxID=2502781 RepID=A0A5B7ZY64_9BACT|nr:carboxylesterase/lipase family protein [Hymenobacter jejuensis]QDA59958.1 carboxylesterase/lipase family protein [Hymenobacter jejuensis]